MRDISTPIWVLVFAHTENSQLWANRSFQTVLLHIGATQLSMFTLSLSNPLSMFTSKRVNTSDCTFHFRTLMKSDGADAELRPANKKGSKRHRPCNHQAGTKHVVQTWRAPMRNTLLGPSKPQALRHAADAMDCQIELTELAKGAS